MAASDGPTRELDVRSIDGAPFGDIVDALDALASDERLVLCAPFEPAPLYRVLDRRGFEYETREVEDGYRVEITPA